MTGEDSHLTGDGAKTGRDAHALDRERQLDPATGEALRDVQTRSCPTCGGRGVEDCPDCEGHGTVRGGPTHRRTSNGRGGPL